MTSESIVGQDGGTKSPWYRLHLVTCLAILVVTADLVLIAGVDYSTPPFIWTGWPLMSQGRTPTVAVAATNVLRGFTLLGSTAVFLELSLRRCRVRIRLRTLFLMTAVVAAVLAFARWDWALAAIVEPENMTAARIDGIGYYIPLSTE